MVRIKILEDDPADRDTLIECLRKYEREQGQSFSITAYDNPSDFMDNYHMDADLIFMDIELPGINGIETSHQLRAADPVVALVFITNMEQYAINGYEVDALDFVIKPINYYRLRRWTKGYTIKQPNMDCQPTEITALMRHRAVFSWAGKGGIPIYGA